MNGWIGVDLDGTLAQYEGWKGVDHIGEPVPAMLFRVRKWLAEGRQVRIFTARISPFNGCLVPEYAMPMPIRPGMEDAFKAACAIAEWCRTHFGVVLPITNVKDYAMIELWDDRAVRVQENTGEPCCSKHAQST